MSKYKKYRDERDKFGIRESSLKATLLAMPAILATSFFISGCSCSSPSNHNVPVATQPTTVGVEQETTTALVQPPTTQDFETVDIRTYLDDTVGYNTLASYKNFMNTSEKLGDPVYGEQLRIFKGTNSSILAGVDANGEVLGYVESTEGYEIKGAVEYLRENFTENAYMFVNGVEHEYWFTGENAMKNQEADASSGKWSEMSEVWAPFSEEITEMEAEGLKTSCTVYRGDAAEEYKEALEEAKKYAGLVVNAEKYTGALMEEGNTDGSKVYVDLGALGEALHLECSDLLAQDVLVAFGGNELDIEYTYSLRKEDWGFGMYFVKFYENSSEEHDRVFVEYEKSGKVFLRELDLGEYVENEGELLRVDDGDVLRIGLDVKALEQVLGLEVEIGEVNGECRVEVIEGDLKPQVVLISNEQYKKLVLREEEKVPGSETESWDTNMSYGEAIAKALEDGEMSTDEAAWISMHYEKEIADMGNGGGEKETESEPSVEPETKPVEPETTTSTPAPQPTTPVQPSGGEMTAEQQRAAAMQSMMKTGSLGYNIAPNRDDYGPGVNKTATCSGMVGEVGRIITWTDGLGYTWTAVTSGEVIYSAKDRVFYDVVTPLTCNGEDAVVATNGYYDSTANYFITSDGGFADIRKGAYRDF